MYAVALHSLTGTVLNLEVFATMDEALAHYSSRAYDWGGAETSIVLFNWESAELLMASRPYREQVLGWTEPPNLRFARAS